MPFLANVIVRLMRTSSFRRSSSCSRSSDGSNSRTSSDLRRSRSGSGRDNNNRQSSSGRRLLGKSLRRSGSKKQQQQQHPQLEEQQQQQQIAFKKKNKKCVRFADEVTANVHSYEPPQDEDKAHLYIGNEDVRGTVEECLGLVQQYKEAYVECIESMDGGECPGAVAADDEDSCSSGEESSVPLLSALPRECQVAMRAMRGLEGQVVPTLRARAQRASQAVLSMQMALLNDVCLDENQKAECLRLSSLRYSETSSAFARKLAGWDAAEAARQQC